MQLILVNRPDLRPLLTQPWNLSLATQKSPKLPCEGSTGRALFSLTLLDVDVSRLAYFLQMARALQDRVGDAQHRIQEEVQAAIRQNATAAQRQQERLMDQVLTVVATGAWL